MTSAPAVQSAAKPGSGDVLEVGSRLHPAAHSLLHDTYLWMVNCSHLSRSHQDLCKSVNARGAWTVYSCTGELP